MSEELNETITLRLSTEMIDQIKARADEADETVGGIIRWAIDAFFNEDDDDADGAVEGEDEDDEFEDDPELNEIKECVRSALAESESWDEFQVSLGEFGLRVRPKGGGVAISRISDGFEVKASSVGPSYSKLILKFGAGLEGHSHKWIEEKMLASSRAAGNSPRRSHNHKAHDDE